MCKVCVLLMYLADHHDLGLRLIVLIVSRSVSRHHLAQLVG